MARRKIDLTIEKFIDDSDGMKYRFMEKEFNDRNLHIYLSEESNKVFNNIYIFNRYIETLDLIFNKINIVGNIYKVHTYIENEEVYFEVTIDGVNIENNFTIDKRIFKTCFGVCIKNMKEYEYADYDKLGWSKNHSAMVIAKAVKAHLVDGIDYEEFIRLHEDKYDFMLRTKVPRSSSLVLCYDDETEVKQQNICRYYPSKTGGKLIKIMPPLEDSEEYRRIGIDTDYNVKTCNNILDFKWDLDYDYYLVEAKKLIDAVQETT